MNRNDIERTRETLRFVRFGIQPDHVIYTAFVSDAELAEMGYVRLLDCEACEGSGRIPCNCIDFVPDEPHECEKCGGSGKGRLVNSEWKDNALAWRAEYVRLREQTESGDTPQVARIEGATRRLAAIDQEDTDGV